MSRLAEHHAKDGLEVLAVNTWNEPVDGSRDFAREHKLRQRILLEGRETGKRYGVYRIPTAIWIDAKGIMVDAALGFDGPEHLERKTQAFLAGDG